MIARIAGISNESVTDGPGVRLTIFFQGCPHACPGCHNPQTWKMDGGQAVEVDELVASLPLTPLLSGVTFSGGDPFAQAEAAARIGTALRGRTPDLWVYTGYLWEELLENLDCPGYRDLLGLADVVVDGPFHLAERDLDLAFRGSRNQRLIRAPESLAGNRIVLWEDGEA